MNTAIWRKYMIRPSHLSKVKRHLPSYIQDGISLSSTYRLLSSPGTLRSVCMVRNGFNNCQRRIPSGLYTQGEFLHTKSRLTSQPTITSFNLQSKDNSDESLVEWNVEEFEERLFDAICDKNGRLSVARFKTMLAYTGLRETDPRLKESMQNFERLQLSNNHDTLVDSFGGIFIDKKSFKECIQDNIILISKAFKNAFIIPEFDVFKAQIDKMYWKIRTNTNGEVANYIPQLARFSPDFWAISVCTVDGQRHSIGDTNVPFCLQSCSKPLTYAMVQNDREPELVHKYVGHEPSGRSFNEISLDYQNKPHNPMINAGAIVLCSLLKPDMNHADRFDYTTKIMKRMTGGEYLAFNNAVFLSERETADRNYALGYYMREKKCFPQGTNLMEVLDFYFQCCSIEVTCDSGAVIAATLANGGICPVTDDKIITSTAVRNTLSLMHSCGMYDWSGEFAFTVGLPAKSGVSGAVLLVIPNVMGICLWSPPLDKWGNSVRGIQFCQIYYINQPGHDGTLCHIPYTDDRDMQELVNAFNFHNYDNLKYTPKKVDPTKRKMDSLAMDVVNVLFGAYNGDVTALRRYSLLGMDMDLGDYDGRTALHLAAAEGHAPVIEFLLHKCQVSPFVQDRWGFFPLDDAIRFGHDRACEILKASMEEIRPGCTDSWESWKASQSESTS